jgi:hypothetical protein
MPRQSALGQHVLLQRGGARQGVLNSLMRNDVETVRGKVRYQSGSIASGWDFPLRVRIG